jgi:general secretion pathway protein G
MVPERWRRPASSPAGAGAGATRTRARGYTIVELVVVCALLGILAAMVLPATKYTQKRLKETELRSALRSMRNAVDEYKRYSDAGLIPVELGTDGYPKELEVLVEGVDLVGQVDKQMKFLRRVPIDPMTGEDEWGLRSFQDEPDSSSWGGENVFDVYSLSGGVGLNGVPYAQW